MVLKICILINCLFMPIGYWHYLFDVSVNNYVHILARILLRERIDVEFNILQILILIRFQYSLG